MKARTNRLNEHLVESEILLEVAKLIQPEDPGQVSADDANVVRVRYQDWYSSCLPILPQDLAEKFRKEYEGGTWSNKIRIFLDSPFKRNVLYKDEPAERSLPFVIPMYQYDYARCFERPMRDQQLILREAKGRLVEQDDSDSRVGMEYSGVYATVSPTQLLVDLSKAVRKLPRMMDAIGAVPHDIYEITARWEKLNDRLYTPDDLELLSDEMDEVLEFVNESLVDLVAIMSVPNPSQQRLSDLLSTIRALLDQVGTQDPEAVVAAIEFARSRDVRLRGAVTREEGAIMTIPVPEVPLVFVGHGHSLLYLKLIEFLRSRLRLNPQSFESEATAGHTIVDVLKDYLSRASFAVIVLTAEDVQVDGEARARQNVVHEVGLFQGKLVDDPVARRSNHAAITSRPGSSEGSGTGASAWASLSLSRR